MMLPLNKPTLLVEVNLQDVFASNSSSIKGDAATNYQIAQATWQDWFQIWLEALYPHVPQADDYELTLRLTDDLEIQSFNSQYRHKNQPTDVLAFAALEVDLPQPLDKLSTSEPLYLGDLVISVETACRQAQQQQHSLTTEIVWLAAHGFLHLLGWDHCDRDSLTAMLSQQENLLNLVGINVPESLKSSAQTQHEDIVLVSNYEIKSKDNSI